MFASRLLTYGYGSRLRVSTPVPCELTKLSVAERGTGYTSPLLSTTDAHLNIAAGMLPCGFESHPRHQHLSVEYDL